LPYPHRVRGSYPDGEAVPAEVGPTLRRRGPEGGPEILPPPPGDSSDLVEILDFDDNLIVDPPFSAVSAEDPSAGNTVVLECCTRDPAGDEHE